jgi:hypothetical protein
MEISFNRSQKRLAFNLGLVNYAVSIWPRGHGKSFIIAWLIHMILKHLPRTKWLLVGPTYKGMLEVTLPSTLRALEYFGYHRDIHYVVGLKPPDHFAKAIEPPTKGYTHTISWFTGNVFHLVSQDAAATSPRGLNADGAITDEALNLDKQKYDEEIAPTLRGNRDLFKNVPFHHGEFFFTSRPYSSEAEWLTNAGNYYLEDGHDYELLNQILVERQVEFLETQKQQERKELWGEIQELGRALKYYAKDKVFYSEAIAFDNIKVLGLDYFERNQRRMSYLKFMVEIMNKMANQVEGGFYANFSRKIHCYRGTWVEDGNGAFVNDKLFEIAEQGYRGDITKLDNSLLDRDCITTLPLRIGVDWGANINSLVVGQRIDSLKQFNFINCFHVKWPLSLHKVIENFCDYYRYHTNRILYFHYDRNGNSRKADSKETYAEQAIKIFIKNGFDVIPMTQGLDPFHNDKYLLWNLMLGEAEKEIYRLRFNRYRFNDALISMEGTKTKEKEGKIGKDKGDEGKDLETEERTTHYGDASDVLLWGEFANTLTSSGFFIENHYG